VLYPVLVRLDLLLILFPLKVILQFPEYVLALLYPILYHRSSAITKGNLYKRKRFITVQSHEWNHTNGHVISGVVTIFPQVYPPNPCLLLPCYIISEVSFHPLVDYFSLPISLKVVDGARGQIHTNQPE
jgi:hypothetical protein